MPTYLDRVWQQHVIADLGDGMQLLHVDRHMLHELSSPQAFSGLIDARRQVRHPELTFAVPDHIVSTSADRGDATTPGGAALIQALRSHTRQNRIRLFDLGDAAHGISHMVAAEQGISLPGLITLCGDAHTATAGALGAIAWGLGTSEVEHVLATQTIVKAKPRSMRVWIAGALQLGVSAKDIVLALIGRVGTRGAAGHAIEFAGPTVRAMHVEQRATLCNMSAEAGATLSYVLPDETTYAALAGKMYAPKGRHWRQALDDWRALAEDADGPFDREITLDVSALTPQMTWGTTPAQVIGIEARIPVSSSAADQRAHAYMGLSAGSPLQGLPIDSVFIGSCTNGRLSDLRAAADVLRGRRIAPGVRMLVVPGSAQVRHAAEAEGLDRVFVAAGAAWQQPGCSMCAGLNPDTVAPAERCVSTANRNVEGRPGPHARIHLASPATAAACAIAGQVADPRPFLERSKYATGT